MPASHAASPPSRFGASSSRVAPPVREVRSVFERIPSVFRFPDNRSSVSRDDGLDATFGEEDNVSPGFASPPPQARLTHSLYNSVELCAKIKSLEAENEMLRHQVADSSLVSSRRVQGLTTALEATKMERDATQVALVREKERCFLLQRRVALLEASQYQPPRAAPSSALRREEALDARTPHRSADSRGATPPPLVPDESDYILSSLRPTSHLHHHHHRGSESPRAMSGHAQEPGRPCFRLNQSFSAADDHAALGNPTVSALLPRQTPWEASLSSSWHPPTFATAASVPAATDPWLRGAETLASALSDAKAPLPSRPPPSPPLPPSIPPPRSRTRSRRFQSPLFGTPSGGSTRAESPFSA